MGSRPLVEAMAECMQNACCSTCNDAQKAYPGIYKFIEDSLFEDKKPEMENQEEKKEGWIKDEDGRVFVAAEDFIKESAEAGAKTEADSCGQLYDAVDENNFEKVKEILCWDDKSQEKVEFRKWYVNEKAWYKWRPLHAAAEAGYTEIAQFLIDCGAEIDAETNVRNTALQLATAGGHIDIVKMLLKCGANVMIETEGTIWGNPLHFAAAKK